ncbi:MAG: hypothetical protein J6R45_00040 [Clostridia bacterium]|nr:hypothetical protein [Clostridia bacterium]
MDFNPIDKINELIRIFEEHNPIIRSKSNEGYEWLEESSLCIEIPNPNSDDSITIECEDGGEFTVCFSYCHQHFFANDFGFDYMCKEISDILYCKCCSAALFCGSENEWFGSTLAEKDQIVSPIEDVFDFVFENANLAEKLYKNGGEARFDFWDSKLNKKIKIGNI